MAAMRRSRSILSAQIIYQPIRDVTLNKLKCSECGYYLSRAPVMLKANGESICGRCYSEEVELMGIRNVAYENMAMDMKFPCIFNSKGCKEIVPWHQVSLHEEGCMYGDYRCPTLPANFCPWKGTRSTLLEHLQKSHPLLLIDKNPCNAKPSLKEYVETNNFITLFGLLFLIQVKYNQPADQIWHSVKLIGNSKLALLFEYSLEITNGRKTMKEMQQVQKDNNKALEQQGNSIIETNANALKCFFGDYSLIRFNLEIKEKECECYVCKNKISFSSVKNTTAQPQYSGNTQTNATKDIYLTEEHYFCINCKPENGTSLISYLNGMSKNYSWRN